MTNDPGISTPTGIEREADGRLVGLVFESRPPLLAHQGNLWLVAVDGSDNALRAVAYAASQAAQLDFCTLHLVHVAHWLSKEAAEAELASRAWLATASARAMLDATGRTWRLHVVMGEPAEKIIALAGQLGASHVVIGRRGLGVAASLLSGSVAAQVMHRSPLPVMVVP